VVTNAGDPGVMVFVVPPGAVALVIGVGLTIRAIARSRVADT
jgi:hypothetical protein